MSLQAQSTLRSFLREAETALEQCSTAQDAATVLALLHSVLPLPNSSSKEARRHQQQDALHSTSTHSKKLAQQLGPYVTAVAACAHDGAALLSIVYWQCFEQLTTLLLTAAEAPWWPDLPPHQQQLCMAYLEAAPAPVLLHGLLGYISCVTPSTHASSRSRVQVAAVGAASAARMLQQRFSCATQDNGLQELLLYITAMQLPSGSKQAALQAAVHNQLAGHADTQSQQETQAAPKPSFHSAAASGQRIYTRIHSGAAGQPILLLPPGWDPPLRSEQPAQASAEQAAQASEEMVYVRSGASTPQAYQHIVGCHAVAGMLVSLPDRLAVFRLEHTDHGSFYMFLMQQLLAAASAGEPVQATMARIRERLSTLVPSHQQPVNGQHPTRDVACDRSGRLDQEQDLLQGHVGAKGFQVEDAAWAGQQTRLAVAVTAARLCAELMQRLCSRGATNMVADSLVQHMQQAAMGQSRRTTDCSTSNGSNVMALISSIDSPSARAVASPPAADSISQTPASVTAFEASHASSWPAQCDMLKVIVSAITTHLLSIPSLTTKLLQALIISQARAHAEQLPTDPFANTQLAGVDQQHDLPCQQQHQQAVEGVAGQLLQLIGGCQAITSQPELRYAVTEQLAARIPLPTPAMHLLVHLLVLACKQPHKPTVQQKKKKEKGTAAQQQCGTAGTTETGVPSHRKDWPEGLLAVSWWAQQLVHGSAGSLHYCTAAAEAGQQQGCQAETTPAVHCSSSTEVTLDLGEVVAGLATLWGDVHPLMAAGRSDMAGKPSQPAGPHAGVGPEAQAATARAGNALPRHAYLSCVLLQLLARLHKQQLECIPGLMSQLLSGVSHRLASPLLAVRRQAMRVGQALSAVLDPDSSTKLFQDQGPLTLLTAEERWPGALPAKPHQAFSGSQKTAAHSAAHAHASTDQPAPSRTIAGACPSQHVTQTAKHSAASQVHHSHAHDSFDGDSDDEGNDESDEGDTSEVDSDDEDSLDAYDLHEDTQAEEWEQADPKSLQLRALAAALRKSDAVQGILDALRKVEVLVRVAPDELHMCATELTRALLHCRAPEWVKDEAGTQLENAPEVQRSLALAALTATAPLPAGDALLAEVLSPHLDTTQRLLCLRTLAAAAQELSNPGVSPRIEYTSGQLPRIVYPHMGQASNATPQLAGSNTATALPAAPAKDTKTRANGSSNGSSTGTKAGANGNSNGSGNGSVLQAGKTRVWGHVALRKRAEQPKRAQRNSFADVALRWTHGLLREVDVVKHGVDVLHRDSLLLVGLLHTVGVFAECAALTPAAWHVCNAVMQLLSSPQVHGHTEVAVRRAVLLSAGQVLAGLPASRTAAAMLATDNRAMPALAGSQPTADDANFAQQLRWMQGWLERVEQEDADTHCRAMATACKQLHTALAADAAMQALSLDQGPWPGSQAELGSSVTAQLPAGSVAAGPLGIVRQAQVLLPHHVYNG